MSIIHAAAIGASNALLREFPCCKNKQSVKSSQAVACQKCGAAIPPESPVQPCRRLRTRLYTWHKLSKSVPSHFMGLGIRGSWR